MARIEISIDYLREMIGATVIHEGTHCKVVEVIEEGPHIVLVDLNVDAIQSDQYGSPHRRVPRTYLIPVHSEEPGCLHPDYQALVLVDRD